MNDNLAVADRIYVEAWRVEDMTFLLLFYDLIFVAVCGPRFLCIVRDEVSGLPYGR